MSVSQNSLCCCTLLYFIAPFKLDTNLALTFDANTDAICTKAHQRMHFYQTLRSFNVNSCFMRIFYSCFIEFVLTFFFICWFGSLSFKNKKKLENIVRMCSKIAGISLNELSLSYRARATRKAQSMSADCTHPLFAEYKLLPSGRRYALPGCRTNCPKN